MKGINAPGQVMNLGGVAPFSAPRDGVSHLAFPALAPERNHHADSFPLAPLGNEKITDGLLIFQLPLSDETTDLTCQSKRCSNDRSIHP
ncbi:hypothetical protein [Sphaerochaeta halotolerans]|uniref:hypothetical protein n=1 Tax=Sphaerochaeta halotolerans TaxID=2293840 RepID=UPI0010584C24|nr:hypothetical protein [Sphaerochaeta halotolerans]